MSLACCTLSRLRAYSSAATGTAASCFNVLIPAQGRARTRRRTTTTTGGQQCRYIHIQNKRHTGAAAQGATQRVTRRLPGNNNDSNIDRKTIRQQRNKQRQRKRETQTLTHTEEQQAVTDPWSILNECRVNIPVGDGGDSPSASSPSPSPHVFVDFFPPRPELFVCTPLQLRALTVVLSAADDVAIDTEFVTFPLYTSSLQVFQVATEKVIAAIDYSALSAQEVFSPFLNSLLTKTWILHSFQTDMQIVNALTSKYSLSPRVPPSVFDTQIAAAYLGYGPMIGYSPLLKTVFGVTLSKAATLTDWSKRPLSSSQLQYALNDVKHLHRLRDVLAKELIIADRLSWVEEEMRCISGVTLLSQVQDEEVWRSMREGKKLPDHSVELRIFQQLSAWREAEARKQDQAAILILRPEWMYAIAQQKPQTIEELKTVQGIKSVVITKYGKQMLRVVAEALSAATSTASSSAAAAACALFHRQSHREAGRLKEGLFNLLCSRVSAVSTEKRISPNHIAPRHELMDLASVSKEAIEVIKSMAEKEFKAVPMISNLFRMQTDLLPAELSTQPSHVFRPRVPKQQHQEQSNTQSTRVKYSYSLEDEVEMLKKLKILSGWRRQLIGNELLALITEGQAVAWNQDTQLIQQQATPTQIQEDRQREEEQDGAIDGDPQQHVQVLVSHHLPPSVSTHVYALLSSLSAHERSLVARLVRVVDEALNAVNADNAHNATSSSLSSFFPSLSEVLGKTTRKEPQEKGGIVGTLQHRDESEEQQSAVVIASSGSETEDDMLIQSVTKGGRPKKISEQS